VFVFVTCRHENDKLQDNVAGECVVQRHCSQWSDLGPVGQTTAVINDITIQVRINHLFDIKASPVWL